MLPSLILSGISFCILCAVCSLWIGFLCPVFVFLECHLTNKCSFVEDSLLEQTNYTFVRKFLEFFSVPCPSSLPQDCEVAKSHEDIDGRWCSVFRCSSLLPVLISFVIRIFMLYDCLGAGLKWRRGSKGLLCKRFSKSTCIVVLSTKPLFLFVVANVVIHEAYVQLYTRRHGTSNFLLLFPKHCSFSADFSPFKGCVDIETNTFKEIYRLLLKINELLRQRTF